MDPRKDPGRNGVQAITDAFARRYGINSRGVLYRAIEELLDHQLIVRTREGWKTKNHFALYAVSWLPITHRDGQPLDLPEPAPNGFEHWEQLPKKHKWMPQGLKSKGQKKPKCRPLDGQDAVEMPSVRRTKPRPLDGQDAGICRPSDGSKVQICRPSDGNTLRILEGDTQTLPPGGTGSKSRPNSSIKSLPDAGAPRAVANATVITGQSKARHAPKQLEKDQEPDTGERKLESNRLHRMALARKGLDGGLDQETIRKQFGSEGVAVLRERGLDRSGDAL